MVCFNDTIKSLHFETVACQSYKLQRHHRLYSILPLTEGNTAADAVLQFKGQIKVRVANKIATIGDGFETVYFGIQPIVEKLHNCNCNLLGPNHNPLGPNFNPLGPNYNPWRPTKTSILAKRKQ